MEVLEFLRQRKRMCDYYGDDTCVCGDSRGACPALDIDCSFKTDKPERLIAIVEQWAKEHPEGTADATTPKNNEPCVKTIRDNLEGATYRAIAFNKTRIENLEHDVAVIRINLSVLDDRIYALREKVDHTPTMEPSQTQEPKRTNKDVLLAVLPNVDTQACPKVLDMNYKCDKRKLCAVCKHEFWNADAHIDLRRLRNDSTCIACVDSCDGGDYPKFEL